MYDARQNVRAGADMFEELDQIIDIVVQIERAFAQRHHLRVPPIGDVDVMPRQHPLHGAAQQRGVVPRHRRYDQQSRLAGDASATEMLTLAERLAQHDLFGDRHLRAVDHRRAEAERGLSARRRCMREDIEA